MNPEQFKRIEELFEAARGLPGPEREQFLANSCPDDAEVRDRVGRLLRSCDRFSSSGDEIVFAADKTAATDAMLGRRIGPYRVVSVLGGGGMGTVYLAEQDFPRRKVAVKLINPRIVGPDALRRFSLEAEVLGRLEHPDVARILDAGHVDFGEGEQPFLVMDLVDGIPITKYADQARLGIRDRAELVARLADAIQHAHQRGVIHRDLKPANILAGSGGALKVLDFGVARLAHADVTLAAQQTTVGQIVGTLSYMAPEQARGEPREIDVRSDVYSVGAVAYELLTGTTPHDLAGLSIVAAVYRISQEQVPPLRSANPALNRDLECIVEKALAPRKEDRYASAAELAADVRRHLSGEPISLRSKSIVYQLTRFAARHRGLGVAAVLLLLSIPLLAWATYTFRAERDELLDRAIDGLFLSAAERMKAKIKGADLDYELARDLVIETRGPDHPLAIQSTQNLALLLLQLERPEDSEPLLLDLYERRYRLMGPSHITTLLARASLGRALLDMDYPDEADAVLRECQDRVDKADVNAERFQKYVDVYRGQAAMKQNRLADAEMLLTNAAQFFESHSDASPHAANNIALATASLLRLYEAWEQVAPCEDIRAKVALWRCRVAALSPPGSP